MAYTCNNLDLLKINTMSEKECKKWARKQERDRQLNAGMRATKNSEFVNRHNVDQTTYTPWRVYFAEAGKMIKIDVSNQAWFNQLKAGMNNKANYEYQLKPNGIKPKYNKKGKLKGVKLSFSNGLVKGSSARLDGCWKIIFEYLTGEEDNQESEEEEEKEKVLDKKKKDKKVFDYEVSHVAKGYYERINHKSVNNDFGPYVEYYELAYKEIEVLKKDFRKFPSHFLTRIFAAYNRFKKNQKDERKKERKIEKKIAKIEQDLKNVEIKVQKFDVRAKSLKMTLSKNAIEPNNTIESRNVPAAAAVDDVTTHTVREGCLNSISSSSQMPNTNLFADPTPLMEAINQTTIARLPISTPPVVPPKVLIESLPNQDLTKMGSVTTNSAPFECIEIPSQSNTSTWTLTTKCTESNVAHLEIQKDHEPRGTKHNASQMSKRQIANKKPRKTNKLTELRKKYSSLGQCKSKPKPTFVQQKKNLAPELIDDLGKKTQRDNQFTKSPESVNCDTNLNKHGSDQFASISNRSMACANEPLALDEIVKTIQLDYTFNKRSDPEDRGGYLDNHPTDQFASSPKHAMSYTNQLLENEEAVRNLNANYETLNTSVENSLEILDNKLPSRLLEFAEPSPIIAQSPVAVPPLVDNIDMPTIEHSTEPANDLFRSVTLCPSVGNCLNKNIPSSTISSADNHHITPEPVDVALITNQPLEQTQTFATLMHNQGNDLLKKVYTDCIINDEPESDLAMTEGQNPSSFGNPEPSGLLSNAQTNPTVQSQADSIPMVSSGSFVGFKPILEAEAAAALMNYHQTWNANPPVGLGIHGPGQSLNMVQNPVTIPTNFGQQVWPQNWNSLDYSGYSQGSSQPLGLAQINVQAAIPLAITNHQSDLHMATRSIPDHSGQQVWHGNQNSLPKSGFMQGLSHPYVHHNRTVKPQKGAPLVHKPLHTYRHIAPKPIKKPKSKKYPVLRPSQNPSVGAHSNVWQSGTSSFAVSNLIAQTQPMAPLANNANVPLTDAMRTIDQQYNPLTNMQIMTQCQNPMVGRYFAHHGLNDHAFAHTEHNSIVHENDDILLSNVRKGYYGPKAFNDFNKIEAKKAKVMDEARIGYITIQVAIYKINMINQFQNAFVSELKNGAYASRIDVEYNRSVLERWVQIPTVSSSTSDCSRSMNHGMNAACLNYDPHGQMNPGQSAVPPMGLHYPMNTSGMMMYPNQQNGQAAAATVHYPSRM